VTFGIVPTTPETGYGYIHTGEQIPNGGYKVAEFVEKPEKKVNNKIVSNTRFTEKVVNSMRVKYFFINSECVSQVE
jgi:mannose-1-phosphate guanylyltransferase